MARPYTAELRERVLYGEARAGALAAADRRLRRTHRTLGLGAVGITIPTPRM